MVVREDGTKWACSSCLKGHRVSGCTHTDRELIHVPKKGRPITQCQHCRQERKKRSAHVRCDCGEDGKIHHPKEKCIHLREADERQRRESFRGEHLEDIDTDLLVAVAEEQGCCCHHGGSCSCSLKKKEHSGDDGTPPHGKPAVQKPKLESTHSDTQLTVFQNGHHKPVHRKNHAAHDACMPYKLPMQRSHTDDVVARVARRSVDNLILETSKVSLPKNHPIPTSAPFETGRRMSKSEHASPRLLPLTTMTSLPPAPQASGDLSSYGLAMGNPGLPPLSTDAFGYANLEPTSSVADSYYDPSPAFPSSDASVYPNNNPFGVWPTNNDLNTLTQPALTATSSGTQSEVDDLPHDEYGVNLPPSANDLMLSTYNLEPSTSSGQHVSRNSLPPDFFSNFGFNVRLGSDASQHLNVVNGLGDLQPKDVAKDVQPIDASNKWHFPDSPLYPNPSQRPADRGVVSNDSPDGGNLVAGSERTSAQSMGPATVPNEDIMKELFPGIDVSSSNSTPNGHVSSGSSMSPMLPDGGRNDFSGFDGASEFTSPVWNENSMAGLPPNFDASFDFNQEFSPQQTYANWAQ